MYFWHLKVSVLSGTPLLYPSGRAQPSFSLVKPFQASTHRMQNHIDYIWAMCQASQWKKYLISHLIVVETLGLSLGTTLKHKHGPLMALSMAWDSAHLAMVDLAERFFGIFQMGNKETEAVPLRQWGLRYVRWRLLAAMFPTLRKRHDWGNDDCVQRKIYGEWFWAVFESWSPAVLELPKVTWDNLTSCQ